MMRKNKTISPIKVQEVALLTKYMNEYNVIGLVAMEKIDARSITKLRAALRGEVVMRMSKKRLIKKAIANSNKKNLALLEDEMKGISAMVFTNMNPIKLAKFLEDNATKGPAKAGDIAPEDIMVKAGDTRIPPGPIISDLNSILKLPTMIKDGMIHVRSDTITHKTGQKIDLKQAMLLGRLGLEPMEVKLNFYSAWENDEIIPEEVLKLDEGKIISDVQGAHNAALALAMSLGILIEETIEPLLLKAVREATSLGLELPLFIPDLLPNYVGRAVSVANSISALVFGVEEEEVEVIVKKKDKKKSKTEQKDDDEIMGEGIGALFG